jgi:hypothetical protein
LKLSIPQLIGLAQNAGFSGVDLQTAVAVALTESGGNPQAYNPERTAGAAEGHGSFGLWQIYTTAHPEFAGLNLTDPAVNAGAAFSVYTAAGNSFRPWSTFKNNAYVAHMDAVGQALAAPADTQASDTGSAGGGPDTGQMVALLAGGALVFWALSKAFGG